MIYKLTYTDKEQALADLKAKGILVEVEFNGEKHEAYGNGVQAVVEIGLIMITPPVIDEDMNIITPAVYADGYHYDVMSTEVYDFGANLVEPKNPKHAFAGHAITEEFPYEPNIQLND
jgi:hypothetical protein